MKFSLWDSSTTGLWNTGLWQKEKEKRKKPDLWHYNDEVPRSMCFSLGIDIRMCPVFSGGMTDMI